MEYFKYVINGLIQGLTEFIPVSSTAHLKVVSNFLGIDDPGTSLSAIIQLGSVLALICYFWNDIFKIKSQSSKKIFDYLLHESKSFMGIECNEGLVIPLTSGLLPGPCL